jgi:hypothetical protein
MTTTALEFKNAAVRVRRLRDEAFALLDDPALKGLGRATSVRQAAECLDEAYGNLASDFGHQALEESEA